MFPDKFIDSFIEDIYTLGFQDLNIFWIRGNKGDNNYVKTKRKVDYIGETYNLIEKLEVIKESDIIWVHWYDLDIGDIVLNLKNKLVVSVWGGEFTGLPENKNNNFLYDKFSENYIYNSLKPKIEFNSRLIISSVFNRIFFALKPLVSKKDIKKRENHMSRIDYLLISELNFYDYNLYKKLNPTLSAPKLGMFYNSNFNISRNIEIKRNQQPVILLGNSADPSNNHFEAFNLIKNLNHKVYVPLSYGDMYYANEIRKIGEYLLGDKFTPIINYMERDEYINFLSEIDIGFFYHNFSQAFGNIIALLTLGKVVFLKPDNSLYQLFNDIGINCYDATQIYSYNLSELILKEQNNRSKNIAKINFYYSDSKRLSSLKNVFRNII